MYSLATSKVPADLAELVVSLLSASTNYGLECDRHNGYFLYPETTGRESLNYMATPVKNYPTQPRAWTLPGLYEARGIGDPRLLSGHDFFNYLNESEIAGCEGAINDGRELSAYQPLSYRSSRIEKSNLTSPLSYTQVAENFREKFAPAEW